MIKETQRFKSNVTFLFIYQIKGRRSRTFLSISVVKIPSPLIVLKYHLSHQNICITWFFSWLRVCLKLSVVVWLLLQNSATAVFSVIL